MRIRRQLMSSTSEGWGTSETTTPLNHCFPVSATQLNLLHQYTVIRFLWVSVKFGTCTVMNVNGTFLEDKLCTFTLESTHFIFNLCPIYTHDSASAKFSTNSQETDYSVVSTWLKARYCQPLNQQKKWINPWIHKRNHSHCVTVKGVRKRTDAEKTWRK